MTRVSRGLILLSEQTKLTARWQQIPRCIWLSNQSLREFHSTETAVNNNGSYISESPKAQTVRISKDMSVNDRYADRWFNHSTTYVCHYIPPCHINVYNYCLKLKRKCEGGAVVLTGGHWSHRQRNADFRITQHCVGLLKLVYKSRENKENE